MSDVIEVVLETTVIEIVQDGLTVEVSEEPIAIDLVEGLTLATNIVAALNAANAPGAENAFATLADVDVLIPDGISERVLLGAADDTVTSSPNFTRSAATGSVTNQATGELAPGLVGIAAGAGAPGVKGSSVEGDGVQGVGSGPSSAGVRGTGASGYGVVGSSTAGIGGVFTGPIGASVGATTDNGTALNISKGNVTLPPGRTVDGVDISEHAADSGAHRNYARIMMMGA